MLTERINTKSGLKNSHDPELTVQNTAQTKPQSTAGVIGTVSNTLPFI